MNRREYLLAMSLLPLGSGGATAETYPERVITIANGYPPGGSTDVSARLMADALSSYLPGAKAVIETRAGASGPVASDWLRRQPADGYTLMLSESSSFAIWPSMHVAGTRYSPLKDFTWI